MKKNIELLMAKQFSELAVCNLDAVMKDESLTDKEYNNIREAHDNIASARDVVERLTKPQRMVSAEAKEAGYGESEDERIRKEIIAILQYKYEKFSKDPKYCNAPQWIAWLEKQGNQREQLINKACDVLVNCIEDYMLRRMEVWDEECKKQTLENIRKKLEE